MKKIQRKIDAAIKQEINLGAKCDGVLNELFKYFDFNDPSVFSVIYQSGDGLVLCDDSDNVYDIISIVKHIEDNGNIQSPDELYQFSI